MSYTLKPGEVAVVLRPTKDDQGEWDGAIHVGMTFGEEDNIEGQREALNMALTMAVTQQVIDYYPDLEYEFNHYKSELLKDMYPEEYAEAEKQISEQEYDKEVKVKGNVYALNAWSKTEGSA